MGTVFKYFQLNNDKKWEHVRSLLTKGEIYFSQPSMFNDLFDCKVTYSETYRVKDLIRFVNECGGKLPNGVNSIYEIPSVLETRKREHATSLIDDRIGVCCFSKLWEDLTMWAHYADNYRGICVGFNTEEHEGYPCLACEEAIKMFNIDSPPALILREVSYTDERPMPYMHFRRDRKNTEILMQFIRTKHTSWSNEQEVRAILPFPKEFNQIVHLKTKDVIKEIIFGVRTDIEYKEKIYNLAKSCNIHLYETVADEINYSLMKVPYKP